MQNRPTWYTKEHDTGWDRVKSAFRNDWEQTKHDMGSDKARDLDQNVGDTVRQATGSEETFDRHEPAFRFGYAAHRNYARQYPKWNDDLDTRLRTDYGTDYDRDRNFIRRAYEYRWGTEGSDAMKDEARSRM